MGDPEFYKKDGDEIAKVQKQATELQTELDAAFSRWEELEAIEPD